MNLGEETFAMVDRQMLLNHRADAKRNKHWPAKGAGKEVFWKRQLTIAIHQVNKNKQFFKNQYATY